MKKLVDTLKSCRVALGLTFTFAALFLAGSGLAFSQITFEKLWEVNHPADYPIDPGFSKDGKFIYAGGAGGIMQMDASNGQFLKYLDKGSFNLGNTESMTIMPDGNHAFTKNKNTGYVIWDLAEGKAIKLFPYEKNRFDKALGVTISPDLRYLVFAIADTTQPNKPTAHVDCTFFIFDIENEQIKDSIRIWGFQNLFAFSSDGKKLVSVGFKNESQIQNQSDLHQKVFLWNTENWTYEIIDHLTVDNGARGHNGFEVVFSPNNLFFSWFPYNRRDVRIYEINSKNILAKSDPQRDCYRGVFLPDSLTYGFCYQKAEFFDLNTTNPQGTLDYTIYQLASHNLEKLFLVYGDSNETLFKLRLLGLFENSPDRLFTATYKDGEIQIKITPNIAEPYSLSVFNLTGKELYKSGTLFNNDNAFKIPIHLTSGF